MATSFHEFNEMNAQRDAPASQALLGSDFEEEHAETVPPALCFALSEDRHWRCLRWLANPATSDKAL